MRNVYFDSVNLNSNQYRITEIDYESSAERKVNAYDLARERGSVFVSEEYGAKLIPVKGVITGSSESDLDSKLHTFKELCSRTGKNLDIDYAGTTLRFKNVLVQGRKIVKRGARDITRAYFELIFLVPSGVGQDTSVTNSHVDNITGATYNGSVNIVGSAKSKPTIKLTFDSNTGGDTVDFQLNGSKVTIANVSAFAASDVLIFDVENKKVTLNGTEKEYSGIFPEFIVGTNNYTITIDGSARQYDLDIDYFAMYL
jgi:hypothetical protein